MVATEGYFHYRKPKQVLTIYYKIDPKVKVSSTRYKGLLSFSSSLWQKKTKQEHWNRKRENKHAAENYSYDCLTYYFKAIEQDDLKLDDIWLKRFIHQQISKYGRHACLNNDLTGLINFNGTAYKTLEECYKSRGHKFYKKAEPSFVSKFFSYFY
jgi:hypothetical protein